jgi:hypothetical protein
MGNIRIEEWEVPTEIIAEVENIVTSNDPQNRIRAIKEEERVIFLEVR